MKLLSLIDGCLVEMELSIRDVHQLALALSVAAEAAAGNTHAMQATGLPPGGSLEAAAWAERFETLRTLAELGTLALLAQGQLVGPVSAQVAPSAIRGPRLPALVPQPAIAGD